MKKTVRIILLALWICLFGMQIWLTSKVDSFHMASEWSKERNYHHIGVYFSCSKNVTPTHIEKVRTKLDTVLMQNKIAGDDTAYNWIDAYSGSSSYYVLDRNHTVIQVTTIGVGGDFFWFHSDYDTHKWIYGSAFSAETEKNQVVLTASCAWALFGSLDVVGMEVQVGQNTYIVSGVVEDDTDFFATDAGFNKYTIYMPYEQLKQEVSDLTITQYEVIFPEIIRDYASKKVTQSVQNSGINGIFLDKTNASTLENRWELIRTLPKQLMKTEEVHFSYWENEAQGWTLLLAIVTLSFGVATGLVVWLMMKEIIVQIEKHKSIIKIVANKIN